MLTFAGFQKVSSQRSRFLLILSFLLPTLLLFSFRYELTRSSVTSRMHSVQNNLFRYGNYCGPGPDDWDRFDAVDHVDAVCRTHDKNYRTCHENLNLQIGYKVPKIINQIMPIRFLIPKFLLSMASRDYLVCMHNADDILVRHFDSILISKNFPVWWQQTKLAPKGRVCSYILFCRNVFYLLVDQALKVLRDTVKLVRLVLGAFVCYLQSLCSL